MKEGHVERLNVTEKAKLLILLARTTNDPNVRRQCCMEAKMLIDIMEPKLHFDDPIYEYINTYYDLTLDVNDKISKMEVINDYRERTRDYLTSKKEISAAIANLGVVENKRGSIGDRHGIYVFTGMRRKS